MGVSLLVLGKWHFCNALLSSLKKLEEKNKMETELIKQNQFTQDQIDLIKRLYAKNATEDEFALFLNKAKLYDLNPMRGEIFFMKYGSLAQMVVGRDGFLKLAHRDPNFDGIQSDEIRDDKGNLTGAWCEVYRKDWAKPLKVTVRFEEYASSSNPLWRSKPSTMIKKVAMSQALRMAFCISGIYSEEELDQVRDVRTSTALNASVNIQPEEVETITEDQQKNILEIVKQIAEKKKINVSIVRDQAKAIFKDSGYDSLKNLPKGNYETILSKIKLLEK